MNIEPDYPPDIIHVSAAIAPDGKTPLVFWHYCGSEGTLTVLEARARAEALLLAAVIAETEAITALAITDIENPKLKGFGRAEERKKINTKFMKLRGLMVSVRLPLPEGITPIFGQKTRLPLVDITCYGKPIQAEVDTVRDHAYALLQSAEASEQDRFFHYFLSEEAGLEIDDVSRMLQSFAAFRNRVQLQELLEKS